MNREELTDFAANLKKCSPFYLIERFAKNNLLFFLHIKCSKYWTDCSNTELYGEVTIENVSEKHHAFFYHQEVCLIHKQGIFFKMITTTFMCFKDSD